MITSLKTQLSLLLHTAAQGSRAAALGSYSLFLSSRISLLFSSLLKLCCSLSVSIYRQEWCHQLQFFFNKDGCQRQPFFNNDGSQPLTFGKVAHGWCNSSSSCCICQWTVLSINGCCILMATNPTDSSNASVVNSSFLCF